MNLLMVNKYFTTEVRKVTVELAGSQKRPRAKEKQTEVEKRKGAVGQVF